MLKSNFIYNLIKILALLTSCICKVNGIIGGANNQCYKFNEICNPHNLQTCCDKHLSCKFKESRNNFYCGEKAKLEAFCIRNDDCNGILHAKCSVERQCVCRENNIGINETYCAPSLGAFCWKDEKCATYNAVCIDSQCQCKDNYFRSNDQCLPMILGSYCTNHTDCQQVQFSKCSELKVCICSFNTMAINRTTCVPLLRVPCQVNEHCKVKNSICVDNECQCKIIALTHNDNECALPHLDMPCDDSRFCAMFINHTTCSDDNKCICGPNNYEIENKCMPAFSAECWIDDKCATDNAMCINNKCQCKPHYIYHGPKCVPIALHETCEIKADCSAIRFGTCSKYGKCTCEEAYVKINEMTCAPSVGAACSEEIKCVPANLICHNNKCQYYSSTSTLSNDTNVRVTLGSSCQADSDCLDIPYSICSADKICICDSNTIALNLLTCVPTVNGFCTNDNQCYLESFYCINNTCQCKPNSTPVSAHQCIKTHLLYYCDDSTECSDLWHSRCSYDGRCICKLNNIAINNSTCLPTLDGYCWRNDQCMPENSVCIHYRCTCKSNFIVVAGNMCVSL